MTREVEFAFWHKQKKEMWSVQSIDWDAREVCNGGDIASLDDGTLLQYTGLEDKNGKEMCEGDLVQCYDHKVVVIGNIECFIDCLMAVRRNKAQSISLKSQVLEIIGNIFENPELLKNLCIKYKGE